MIKQTRITYVLAAMVLASAGFGATISPANAQTTPRHSEPAPATASGIPAGLSSGGNAVYALAQKSGPLAFSASSSSKPTFRRPAFMTWAWILNHRQGN